MPQEPALGYVLIASCASFVLYFQLWSAPRTPGRRGERAQPLDTRRPTGRTRYREPARVVRGVRARQVWRRAGPSRPEAP
jgi:hypothetical protein